MTTLTAGLSTLDGGERTLLRQGDRSVSVDEFRARTDQFAQALIGLGAARGDNIALLARESIEYVVALFGIWKAGAVAVPLSALSRSRELDRVFEFCDVSLAIADEGTTEITSQETLGHDRVIFVSGEAMKSRGGTLNWSSRMDFAGTVDVTPNDLALLVHTSGTTSSPKTVMLTHRNLQSNVAAIVDYLGLGPSDKIVCVLPFHYVYGNSVLLTHIAAGAEVIVGTAMSFPQQVVNEVDEFEATGFSGVASTYQMLLERTDWERRDFPHLRYLTQAGGPMPYAQVERLLKSTKKDISFFVMYGQTEAAARLTYLPPAMLSTKAGSVGIALDGVTITVQDDHGAELAPGQVGEVCARGPNIMKGYWKNPEATAAALKCDWLHTGDMGYLDADGFLYLRSRKSDIIKTGAHRVNPMEIEELIAEVVPGLPVAVVGVADELLGERIRIVAEGSEDKNIARRIMRHCKQNLPPYKMPRELVWIDRLPRTHSGKIRKSQLVES